MTKKMAFRSFLIAWIFLNLFFSPPTLWGEILQYENQTINSIEIYVHAGSDVIADTNANITRLRTRQGGLFSQADFDEDLKILSEDYDRVEPYVENEIIKYR